MYKIYETFMKFFFRNTDHFRRSDEETKTYCCTDPKSKPRRRGAVTNLRRGGRCGAI
jgi:hypothetical protein